MADRVVLLDTHALVWWTEQPDLLGKNARAAVESAARIVVPAIVFWEVALLVRKKRLSLGEDMTPVRWMDRVLAIPRLAPAPLTPAIAVAADGLTMHPDPADRFIVATALQEKAPIVTKDGLLRDLALVRTIW
jgi:PIN domain nuclease of toxin-antitoxin system